MSETTLLLPGVVDLLIQQEANPLRFEAVCRHLYESAEGVRLVATSRTYDLGRDGRSISSKHHGLDVDAVLCATLASDWDEKVERDLRRLQRTTTTAAVVYATSHKLTEQACDRIAAKIRGILADVNARVLGRTQLVDLAERHPQVFRQHYPAEIRNVEQVLLSPRAGERPQNIGLRLALATQTGDDARDLRSRLTKKLVLETLASGGELGPGTLAARISQSLHLSRSLSSEYISAVVDSLAEQGFIEIRGDVAKLTARGTAEAESVPQEAPRRLLEGRATIREEIRRLTGRNLQDDDFRRFWDTFQDGVADLFYSHGAATVRAVGSMLSGQASEGTTDIRSVFERLADRVAALYSDSDMSSELRQSVLDMFADPGSAAFRWLADTSSVYVMMCSLGFEALSSREVTAAFRALDLVPDTDVVLSLLCSGEPNHEHVNRLINGWRALGGSILAATPVLEEAAHHAWIAQREYDATEDLLATIRPPESWRALSNAFVRAFAHDAHGRVSRREWFQFISEYRGQGERDSSLIWEILGREYGFQRLPTVEQADLALAEEIRRYLVRYRAQEAECAEDDLDVRVVHKCRRDAELLASIKAARTKRTSSAQRGTVLLLSSARFIVKADERFRAQLGQPEAVISPTALGTMLTLTPGVEIGLDSLREILFDFTIVERLKPVQQLAYRIISTSQQYSMPWSRRVTLERRLAEELLRDARARDLPVGAVQRRFTRGEDPSYTARLLAGALDEMVATPDLRRDLEAKDRRIAELEQRLRTLEGA